MRYHNPQKSNLARKNRAPYFKDNDYRKLSFPERSERDAERNIKRKIFNMPRIILIASIVVALVIASIIIIPTTAKAQYFIGYEVFLCGKSVGIVDNPDEVDEYLKRIRQELEVVYGMEITDQLEIEYKQVETNQNHISPAEVFTNLIKDSIDVRVVATIIYVNDWPAAVVKTSEEANWVLESALEPYKTPTKGAIYSDIEFVETVRVERGPADYSHIVDKETALHNLTIGPGIEDKWRIVVTGDSLSRIAKQEKIKISDIRIANPSVSSTDSIYPGDRLRVVVPKNSLSIKFKEIVDRIQEMPYETEILKDDTKFTTEKEIIQQGINGQSKVKAEITYVNGIEVEFITIEKKILVDGQKQIIKKGTRPVPKELIQAVEGRMPMPLRKGSYRISSKFGARNTGIKGASKFHKGIDLAASKGTPIYASAAGTIKYSGTASGYGLYVKITHDGGVETRYGHCSQLLVEKGQKVKAGQLIALVGSTGVSSGSHLHFEIRINGEAVDPLEGK